METKFDAYAALKTLGDIVRDFGRDYVYEKPASVGMCVYRHEGKPSCLVGQVLARLVPDFIPFEGSVGGMRDELLNLGFAKDAAFVLQTAQLMQDQKYSWGTAVSAASNAYESFRRFRTWMADADV